MPLHSQTYGVVAMFYAMQGGEYDQKIFELILLSNEAEIEQNFTAILTHFRSVSLINDDREER